MIRDEQIARLMGAGALALILGALGFQYFAHLPPCEMCHWQRWPHIAAVVVGLVVAPLWRNNRPVALGIVAVAAIAGLLLASQWDMLTGWQPKMIAAAIVAALAILFTSKDTCRPARVAIALVIVSGLIGVYQTGLQYHLLPGPQGCTAPRYILGSGAAPPPVRCDIATWFLFGLALPAYNAIASFLIAGTGAFLMSRKRDA
ncbi:MAG TPA: disulfide bond formation protein B [Rhizomicrobium sp.]|nr:disulfide bond formation protein B [Rhizomicrobium sp.]